MQHQRHNPWMKKLIAWAKLNLKTPELWKRLLRIWKDKPSTERTSLYSIYQIKDWYLEYSKKFWNSIRKRITQLQNGQMMWTDTSLKKKISIWQISTWKDAQQHVIKELKIKIIMPHNYTSNFRMANIQNADNHKCSYSLLIRIQNSTETMEDSLLDSNKIKHILTLWSRNFPLYLHK